MSRRDLTGRLARIERDLEPRDGWQVWWPLEDEPDDERRTLVRNVRTGETADRGEIGRRPGRHVVEYVEGSATP